ncbi:MAG: serine hydrolase [Gemmatimonas sp.]|nr:serine hydrolase [Gemmatimonas sp.]
MFATILIATVAASLQADTVLVPGVSLLGESIDPTTPIRERGEPTGLLGTERLPFNAYVSMPIPDSPTPGLPEHFVEVPTSAGFTWDELNRAMSSVEMEVYRGNLPGAAVAVGRWGTTVLERGIGTYDRTPLSPHVHPDHTIYDLASLTKVVATTTAVMLLVEDGMIDLDTPVSNYLPSFSSAPKSWVTIRHLLTHSSGLPAGTGTFPASRWASLQKILDMPLVTSPGERVVYSDLGFVILWLTAEAAYGGSLEQLLVDRVYHPLGMGATRFNPGPACTRCAPTDERDGYRGLVHDPIARNLGGIAGNAGLFSTAHDLSRFAAMLVNGGELNGVRVLQKSTIDLFTQRQPGADTRALGWDTPDDDGHGASGLSISRSAFGHTGFTGTSLWVDPDRGTWTVLLSNRTYGPRGRNPMRALRRELNDFVAVSVDRASFGR